MTELTTNQKRQLAQLAKHNPTLHESVVGELSTIHPQADSQVAGRVIGDGMRILAEQLSQPEADSPQPDNDSLASAKDALAKIKYETSASGIGASIMAMMGREYNPDGDKPIKLTEEQRERSYKAALRSQQPKRSIGSLPTAWDI